MCIVFCKQKTAYEMRICDWSSDVCSSDLGALWDVETVHGLEHGHDQLAGGIELGHRMLLWLDGSLILKRPALAKRTGRHVHRTDCQASAGSSADLPASAPSLPCAGTSAPSAVSASDPPPCSASPFSPSFRSEEHTSELQSLMRISYAVFC